MSEVHGYAGTQSGGICLQGGAGRDLDAESGAVRAYLAEMGLDGEHVPAVLADYRVHKASMLARSTDVRANKQALIGDMRRRHPWLQIPRSS